MAQAQGNYRRYKQGVAILLIGKKIKGAPIHKHPLLLASIDLSSDEKDLLASQIVEGNKEAEDRFARANIRLAIIIASKYLRIFGYSTRNLADELVAESVNAIASIIKELREGKIKPKEAMPILVSRMHSRCHAHKYASINFLVRPKTMQRERQNGNHYFPMQILYGNSFPDIVDGSEPTDAQNKVLKLMEVAHGSREVGILKLMQSGHSVEEVAELFGVSRPTIYSSLRTLRARYERNKNEEA